MVSPTLTGHLCEHSGLCEETTATQTQETAQWPLSCRLHETHNAAQTVPGSNHKVLAKCNKQMSL